MLKWTAVLLLSLHLAPTFGSRHLLTLLAQPNTPNTTTDVLPASDNTSDNTPPTPAGTAALLAYDDVQAYNWVMGTQQVNPKYGFTNQSAIVEAAQVMQAMGSNLIKLNADTTKYMGAVRWANGIDFAAPTTTLLQTISRHPDMVKVFNNPSFKYYLLWAYTRINFPLQKTFESFEGNQTALAADYRQIYELTTYLLNQYQGTGKTFFLGNWEGDWHLLWSGNPPTPKHPRAPNGMIDWANNRQKAIDDAKAASTALGVDVFYYLELNQPRMAMSDPNAPGIVNQVLPYINPDFLSYSSYDSLSRQDPTMSILKSTIQFLQNRLPYKQLTSRLDPAQPWPYGSRVFVGEYGFFQGPDMGAPYSSTEAANRVKAVARVSLQTQVPFMLYWQLYNNDVTDGVQKGWWLIDNNNVKQPVYYVHQNFYNKAKAYVKQFKAAYGRVPTVQEFNGNALAILNTI